MRHASVTRIAFCLIASAGTLFAPGGPGQAESSPAGAKNAAANAPRTSAEAAGTKQAVTVAQLTQAAEAATGKSDADAGKQIERLELSERLSSPELARLKGELPGAGSKAALMAVGDFSVFLEPPPEEMLDKAPPDEDEQRQIVSRASDYLKTIIPKLPDFYASRITNVFEVDWTSHDKDGTHQPGAPHLKGKFQAAVLYRNGKEIVRAQGAEQEGLITQGTFGPVLAIVIKDNLTRPMQWHGWEKGSHGAMAVFQFRVPQKDSHYAVSFGLPFAGRTGYRGEIGIDPDTGTILRLVLQSDPVRRPHFIGHGDIMLEYGSVMIGGKPYTCPVRGVSISRGGYELRHKTTAFILLSDVVFTDYHVFRSELRIVPN